MIQSLKIKLTQPIFCFVASNHLDSNISDMARKKGCKRKSRVSHMHSAVVVTELVQLRLQEASPNGHEVQESKQNVQQAETGASLSTSDNRYAISKLKKIPTTD
jgi:hypothetical protein